MFPQPASSSDTLRGFHGCFSPDLSSCSSDTGDVLIRSTRVLLPDRRHEAESGTGAVQITVHKLPDLPARAPVTEQQQQSPGTQSRQQLRQKPDRAPPLPAAAHPRPGQSSGRWSRSTGVGADRWTLKKPERTKENRKPTGTEPPAAESCPDLKLSAGTHSDGQPDHDLLTSRFAAGGRGVVLAALKQRSHSAPHRKEVRVQLLDPGPHRIGPQEAPSPRCDSQSAVGVAGVQREAGQSSGCLGDYSNAATAHLIKAQSQLEVQVSHLAEGVQKLLRADREDRERGRGLSQQTLHHLETLHSQQLQLQSKLLESAMRIASGHAPVTRTTADSAVTPDLRAPPGQPAHLQVTHLDAAANQQRCSSTTAAETGPVAMETPRHDRWPNQTRGCDRRGSHLQSSANSRQAAVRRANEMLREMERLKAEMKMLLTPEDSLKTTRPEPDHHQARRNLFNPTSQQPEPQQSTSQKSKSQQNMFQSQPNISQPNHYQPKSQQNHFQSKFHQTEPQQSPSQQNPFQPQQSQPQLNLSHRSHQTRSVQVQRRPPAPSPLTEAGSVLRQVQRQKKVLEENLEAMLRARTGKVLHCQLEALADNRDWAEEVRIKKTVDSWISTLTLDIQAEMTSEDAAVTSQRAAGSSTHTGRGGAVSALRGSKKAAGRGSRGQTAGLRRAQEAEPDRPSGVTDGEQVAAGGDSYLSRLYGRAPYEGVRKTLKKGPYLRLSSPGPPTGRKPRPRLVESIRGVKVKSCKTQTCWAPPLSLSPGQPQCHHIISSSHLTSGDPADLTVTPADSNVVPMAIPLGRPRMDSSARCQRDVTSPPTPPPPQACVVAVDDRACDPQEAELMAAGESPPLPPTDVFERRSEEGEDEENVFPGTNFLSVADVPQQEELSVVGEEAVELDGGPSPPPVLYQGPVFPPQALPALPAQDQASVLGNDRQRGALENQLVEWVEQQLMSRMISEMYHLPPSDNAQNNSTDQSEAEEQSVTSDIVEAAGGGGLQLFVDSNVSVDSALIRQLVHEVLTEQVALMLGHRDTPEPGLGPAEPGPEPGPGARQEENLVPLVSTPDPTPPFSPTTPTMETPPLATPPPSEPTSRLDEESPQPITAAEPVATPTLSPEPAPSAGSPPPGHQAPPPHTWGDAELPLDEEVPEEHLDTHTQPLVMSVAQEEPPLSSPLPPPALSPSPPPPPPGPEPRPASPSSSSSSSSSSVVTAGTELKHISEGELLISVNQLAAMTEEEAAHSFSSSLQELQDTDFDPPSEGQVRGRDLLLTLLTKMEQEVTHRGERPRPEGSWGRDQEEVSVGEVSDNWTTNPHRTTSPSRSAAERGGPGSSPGQISVCADVSEVSLEATDQGSVNVGDLMVSGDGALTSDLQTNLSLSARPAHLQDTRAAGQVAHVLVRRYDTLTDGSRRMDVRLPSIRPEGQEEEQEEEEQEQEEEQEVMKVSAADSDSSTNDVF